MSYKYSCNTDEIQEEVLRCGIENCEIEINEISNLKKGIIKNCIFLQKAVDVNFTKDYYEEEYTDHELSIIRKFLKDIVDCKDVK